MSLVDSDVLREGLRSGMAPAMGEEADIGLACLRGAFLKYSSSDSGKGGGRERRERTRRIIKDVTNTGGGREHAVIGIARKQDFSLPALKWELSVQLREGILTAVLLRDLKRPKKGG